MELCSGMHLFKTNIIPSKPSRNQSYPSISTQKTVMAVGSTSKIFPLVSTLIPPAHLPWFLPLHHQPKPGPKIDYLIISMINNTLMIALNKWPILPHVQRFFVVVKFENISCTIGVRFKLLEFSTGEHNTELHSLNSWFFLAKASHHGIRTLLTLLGWCGGAEPCNFYYTTSLLDLSE